jgi:hypothetical protein
MDAIAISLPVQPGKADVVREHVRKMMEDSREHHHNRAREHGFSRIKLFHQHTPDERVIVYLEAHDLLGAMQSAATSNDEFDVWMREMMQESTGTHAVGPMSELMMDWHPEKGHSKKHHD